jgi:hypothetical protein
LWGNGFNKVHPTVDGIDSDGASTDFVRVLAKLIHTTEETPCGEHPTCIVGVNETQRYGGV